MTSHGELPIALCSNSPGASATPPRRAPPPPCTGSLEGRFSRGPCGRVASIALNLTPPDELGRLSSENRGQFLCQRRISNATAMGNARRIDFD